MEQTSDPAIDRTVDGRLLLTAGQKADVTSQEKTVRIAAANIKAMSSWRIGQLIFEGDQLDDIVEQFNRYNRMRIIITDDQLAETEFSGVFDANDPDSLVEFLELTSAVNVDRRDVGIIKISAQ
jgi:Fe2+-dicitrate sensor, membrane component